MFRSFRIITILSIFVLIVSACNLPSGTPTPDAANVVFTAAALTVQAQLTQQVPFSTPTLPPAQPTNTLAPLPQASPTLPPPIPTNTPVQSPTPACDVAQFVKDVTIPDGTVIAPNTIFKKTWRLRNIGTCTWSGYTLVFDKGEAMNPTVDPIGIVAPGQEVDVTVTFTTPATLNTYRSYWRLRNAAGVLLPMVNGSEGKSFYVEVKVAVTSSGYDFHTRAASATWTSGAGNITFGGPDTDVKGSAMYRDAPKVEGGSTASKVLETVPQLVDNGEVRGLFPAYAVVTGERFTARIGFLLQPDGTCGAAGNVKFQLNYKEGGVLKPLGEWTETCDNALRSISVDLTPLAGKSIEFELKVLANGTSNQDVAIWVAPQIALP